MRCYVEALELGADDYFEKSAPPSEIKRVVTPLCLLVYSLVRFRGEPRQRIVEPGVATIEASRSLGS
jgi:DNA-binding response OmpR family regulator